jgi:thiol-disulfide isomerase/thioredoxin
MTKFYLLKSFQSPQLWRRRLSLKKKNPVRILTAIALMMVMSFAAQAQGPQEAPYKRFPNVPPFELLQLDSVTTFKKEDLAKNQPVLIMVFSPDCDHCQHQMQDLLIDIGAFRDVQIVLATPEPFDKMKAFHQKFNLSKYPNIRLGRDTKYVLPPFYRMRNLPFLALYNKKGNLITAYDGNAKTADLIEAFSKK